MQCRVSVGGSLPILRLICKAPIDSCQLDNRMKWETDSSNRAETTPKTNALRKNINLESFLSVKHMRHLYSTRAIEGKAKSQGHLLELNDFIFI